jgi:hypothetical protein
MNKILQIPRVEIPTIDLNYFKNIDNLCEIDKGISLDDINYILKYNNDLLTEYNKNLLDMFINNLFIKISEWICNLVNHIFQYNINYRRDIINKNCVNIVNKHCIKFDDVFYNIILQISMVKQIINDFIDDFNINEEIKDFDKKKIYDKIDKNVVETITNIIIDDNSINHNKLCDIKNNLINYLHKNL